MTYGELYAEKTGPWVQRLIKKGFQMALEGNVPMLKLMLGQYAHIYERQVVENQQQTITLNYSLDVTPSQDTIDIDPVTSSDT
jgi:hypothetical protein